MWNSKKWAIQEQIYFLTKTGELLQKGYSLTNAIELLKIYAPEKRKKDYSACIDKIKKGGAMYEALEEQSFPSEVLSYLFFSETHGDLAFALTHGGQLLKRKHYFTQRFFHLLKYPLLLFFFIVCLFLFIQHVLFPQFLQLFSSLHVPENQLILFFIRAQEFYPLFGKIGVWAIGIGVLGYLFYYRKLSFTKRMSLLYKIPILARLLRLKNTQYVSMQFSSLLKGGLSIYEVISVFEEQRHLPFFQEEAKAWKQCLTKGEHLEYVFSHSKFYEKDLVAVIAHGQANGALDKELEDFSIFVMERLEQYLHKLLHYIQPTAFLFISAVVIFMYISLMLPLLNMMESISF